MHARNEGPSGCVPWEEHDRLERKWIAENTRLRQGLVDVHSKIEEMHRRGGHTWNEVLDIAAEARHALKEKNVDDA